MAGAPTFKSNYLAPFDLNAAIDELRHRHGAFRKIEAVFETYKLSPGVGWDALREKVGGGKKDSDEAAQCIAQMYLDVLLLGPRAICVYADAAFDWKQLEAKAKALIITDGDFTEKYPIPLNQSQLKGVKDQLPQIVEIRPLQNGDLALIFSAVRHFDDRQDIPKSQFPPAVANQMAHFERLVGFYQVHEQAFDAIIISVSRSRLEVRVDARARLPMDQYDALVSSLFHQLSTVLPQVSQLMTSAMNFFPAIREICDDKSQGILESLWFTTHTGLINKERMKNRGEDLRSETYHHGGLSALGQPVSPYHLSVGFEKLTSANNSITITLPGKIRDLNLPSPTLRLAIVEGCVTNEEFARAVNKLISLCSATE